MSSVEEMKKQFGSVEFQGKDKLFNPVTTIVLTEQASPSNHLGSMSYMAYGIDENKVNRKFLIRWDVCEKYIECQEYLRLLEKFDYEMNNGLEISTELLTKIEELAEKYKPSFAARHFVEDEKNACNWDSPDEVILP